MSKRLWASIVGRIAGISEEETLVARRGFTVDRPEVAERLESIGSLFVWGYNLAVSTSSLSTLERELAKQPQADAGFAYEGASMGLTVGDWMTPGRRLFAEFVAGPASKHEYMAWVGMGWAFARLPLSPMRALARHSSLKRWLALDGYGFHQGYFNWRRYTVERRRPEHLPSDAQRVFDQGLGRSLWFVRGASPQSVARAIDLFPEGRREDLWSGIGLAAAYAGGLEREQLQMLAMHAGVTRPALCQGVVFAAEARRKAGNPVDHTQLACDELLRMRLGEAADLAVHVMPSGSTLADYQAWRRAIQAPFVTSNLQRVL